MKYFLKPMLFIFVSMFVFTSCNNEDLFIEETLLADIEETPTDLEDSPNDSDTTVDSSMPCDFTLDSLQAGDTVIINCIMDLGAVTINLPANVTIVFDGGDIINGTLNFSNNSVISGELLNSSLNIMGSTPLLKDTIFNFDPNRWGIVEGVVADDIARNNRDLLTGYFEQLKGMGVNIFKIDKLDAYFKTDNELLPPWENSAILVPSDFNLLMTNNTHLRVQPNNDVNTTLLAIWEVNNVTIDGGVLHGDRDTHDYTLGGTQEWGHCLRVGGSQNIIVKNMIIMDAGGDGIDIHANTFTFKDNYIPAKDVLILNNKILRSRRNGISITDGRDVLVEGNEIIDTGIDTQNSKGTWPKWGIDIEPYQANGEIYEIAEDITIRNNIEKGSIAGAFLIFRGERIIIENNRTESKIGYARSYESIIRNNTLIATTDIMKSNGTGISGGKAGNYGNQVTGNTIKDFATGLNIKDSDANFSDNKIYNCKNGLVFSSALKNTLISNNVINSSRSDSDGLVNGSDTTLDNVEINNNSIDVTRKAIQLWKINETTNFQFNFKNNTVINGTTYISLVNGINY